MTARRFAKVGGAVAACAALGAAGAYIGDAVSSPSASPAASAGKPAQVGRNGQRRGPFRRLARAVHADLVIPTEDGKFATVTVDRGFVEKVQGNTLTLREGTKKATYKTVTLDLASNVVVRIDRQAGKLADVKAGQHAMVVKGPKRTLVIVRNARQP